MRSTSRRCPWWKAWWHRRLRRFDRRVVYAALRETGAKRYPQDDEAAVLMALKGWAMFLQEPGQTHWHCSCAEQDRE